MHYQIKLKGQLDLHYAQWFGDFQIIHNQNDETLLIGEVVDQAALHGILARCRDLGVTIISLNPVTQEERKDTKP